MILRTEPNDADSSSGPGWNDTEKDITEGTLGMVVTHRPASAFRRQALDTVNRRPVNEAPIRVIAGILHPVHTEEVTRRQQGVRSPRGHCIESEHKGHAE